MGGGAGGTGFSPQSGVTQEQINNSYNQNQQAIKSMIGTQQAIQAQNGLGNQSNVYGQLQNIAAGQGPNPAQAMLNQATGANVANQAALMAGQRGAGQNVGLLARQAGQQGANLQQQAAGQGASMQAQQSLGALGQAGQMANTMAANQIGQTNAVQGAQQGLENSLLGANAQSQGVQGQLANTQMQGGQGLIGGLGNALGGGLGSLFGGGSKKAEGGMIGYADGGSINPASGPQSMFGKTLSGSTNLNNMGNSLGNALLGAISSIGASKQSSSPGAEVTTKAPMEQAAKGGNVGGKLKQGGHVPGQAKVKGDSYSNDTVKALLSPGEVVIPRSVMQSGDPVKGAASFVQSVLAKKGRK